MTDVSRLNFEKLNGLIPAVILDNKNDNVLMLGFMNREAFEKTVHTNKVTFFSRSRNMLWTKGESSGNFLHVKEIYTDCDSDSLLIKAEPEGNTCHTGNYSCFEEVSRHDNLKFLNTLFGVIKDRKSKLPSGSYTTRLFLEGSNRIIQKVGEEAIETVIAAKNRDKEEIIEEVSDLVFHLLVMLAEQGIELDEVVDNLEERHK